MKKVLLTVLGVLTLVCILTFTAFAENTSGVLDSGECGADGDNVTWTLYKDGELVISGEGDMADNRPWFEAYNSTVKKVVVNDGITSIGKHAFGGLFYATEFILPESVTVIGDDSLSWLSFGASYFSGNEIKIPENVTVIGKNAFYMSAINRIVIPEKVTTIKERTFDSCRYLNVVVIPAGVTTIENNAFASCDRINTVYFRGTEEQWNNIAFGSGNGYLKTAENIVFNVKGHDYEETVFAPTCTDRGYTSYFCKICDDYYIDPDLYTDLVPHQTTNGQCSECKQFIVEEYAEISLSVNLSTDSMVKWSLSNNNAEIASTGFSKVSMGSYVRVTASATIKGVSVGKATLTATVNGNIVSTAEIEVLKHEHSYSSTVTSPTCTEKGYTTYACICGDSYYGDYTDSLGGHVEYIVSPERPPTCTTNGYEIGSACSICNVVIKSPEYIPPTGHTEKLIASKSATCTVAGLTEGKMCSVCGEILVEQTEIPALGHTAGEWEVVLEAQIGVKGKEELKCTVCGFVIDTKIIPAIPGVTYMLGDVNGDGKVNAIDARKILRVGAQLETFADDSLNVVADVNKDGKVNAIDARKVLRVAAQLETFR